MKIKIISVGILFCIILSACTVQTEFDIYDFCQRYNKLSGEKILSTNDFLSDNENTLFCIMNIGQSTVLITVSQNDNTSLNSVFVTAEKSKYNETDLPEVINAVYRIFGAFNYGNEETAKENLESVGF